MSLAPTYSGFRYKIVEGDCEDVMAHIPDNSVSLVLTDPPYGTSMLHCYRKLRSCGRILRPGGSLICLTGCVGLNQIINILDSSLLLKYHWMCCALLDDNSIRSQVRSHGVSVGWKPLLWYTRGPLKGNRFLNDTVPMGAKQEKLHHIWEQPLSWTNYFVECLTSPGDIVLDPFCGSGSTGVSAISLERNFIGIELESHHLLKTRDRLEETAAELKQMAGHRKYIERTKTIYDTAIGWPNRNR